MTDTAAAAVFRAVKAAISSGAPSIGPRLFLDHVPAGTPPPYAVMVHSGEVQPRQTNQPDAVVTLMVKAVSPDFAVVDAAAAEIDAVLSGAGTQDRASTDAASKLNGGAYWTITTVTRVNGVFLPEMVDETNTVYHAGAIYDLRLERI